MSIFSYGRQQVPHSTILQPVLGYQQASLGAILAKPSWPPWTMRRSRSSGATSKSAMACASAGMSSPAPEWLVSPADFSCALRPELTDFTGGFSTRGADRSVVYPLEGEARVAAPAVRASDLQATVSLCPEPILVSLPSPWLGTFAADITPARLISGPVSGSARSACRGMRSHHTTKTSRPTRSHPSSTLRTPQSNTGCLVPRQARQSSYMSSTRARRRTAWLP